MCRGKRMMVGNHWGLKVPGLLRAANHLDPDATLATREGTSLRAASATAAKEIVAVPAIVTDPVFTTVVSVFGIIASAYTQMLLRTGKRSFTQTHRARLTATK
jgi:hypothetical protein